MRRSTDAILTSHAGSLPRPDELIELNQARREARTRSTRRASRPSSPTRCATSCAARSSVGIDRAGDGEYGKAMGHKVNYGAWWSYSFSASAGSSSTDSGLDDMPGAGRSRANGR